MEMVSYVMADDEFDAEQVAAINVGDDIQNSGAEFCIAKEVVSLKGIPSDWLHSIPWEGVDDTTIEEIVSNLYPEDKDKDKDKK